MLRVYIGYDPAEDAAYRVAAHSLAAHSGIVAEPLEEGRLRAAGLFTRAIDKRGQKYDLPSAAPCSTDFATSRFLVPLLCQTGWALFIDCDMLVYQDVRELLMLADPSKAVMVVKHQHPGAEAQKMGGMVQTRYPRKNWSSVMLFNCDHQANRRLSVRDVNERPGRDLHAFYWLHDSEIGDLPERFNWLVDVAPRPSDLVIAHMTLGGPWVENWQGGAIDVEWLAVAEVARG